ncbi:MAG: VCBS repeat-containing protein, partial [Candidatus Omnitrophica bacterium]|nr:VCBS repeat-containing protein [Candidatus Omnitrophota bacterium]
IRGLRILSSFTGTIVQQAGNSVTVGSNGWDQAGGILSGGDATIDVNGTFTLSGGTYNNTSTTLSVSDNFTLSSTGTFTNASGTLLLDGDLTFTDSTSPQQNVGRVIVGSSPDVIDLASDITAVSITVNSNDTYNSNGYDMDLSGTFTINGTFDATDDIETDETLISIGRSLIVNSGAMLTADQSTMTFDGTPGTYDLITDGTFSLYNVTIDNGGSGLTIEVEDPLDVNGDIIITNGTLDVVSGENNAVFVGGDFDNNDNFLARSGTITFDGSAAQIVSAGNDNLSFVEVTNSTADVTFNEAFTTTDFTSTTPGASMKFQQSTTFTVSGSLRLDGNISNKIHVDSVNGSTRFTFDVTGSDQMVSNVNVSNSNASTNDIYATGSVDGGNNDEEEATPHWVFLVSFSDITSTANLGSSPGGGAVVIFYCNNDGFLDVFMGEDVTPSSPARLRQNDGDNTFTDRDSQIVNDYRGAAAGDYDNDGDTDLIFGFTQRLYTNSNATDCTFTNSTAGSVNNNEAIMFFDIDGDGDLDLWSPGEDYLWHRNDGGTTFTSQTSLPGGIDRH